MWDLIQIKADLLCMGIRRNAVAAEIFRTAERDNFLTENIGGKTALERLYAADLPGYYYWSARR